VSVHPKVSLVYKYAYLLKQNSTYSLHYRQIAYNVAYQSINQSINIRLCITKMTYRI